LTVHHPLSSRYWQEYVLLICYALLLSGCGPRAPETASVTGRVTFHGKAVDKGRIVFYPTEGRPATGTIGPDGSFRLTTFSEGDGALLGKHRVTIEAKRLVGATIAKTFAEERAQPASISEPRVEWIVPEKYAREDTSPLTADVARGGNTINFDLP
jgi:hypothetical protein